MKQKQKLVILGIGFAGLYTYRSMPKKVRKNFDITLVDKNNYFVFTPLIHEVATGSLNRSHVIEPIRSLIGDDAQFIESSIKRINTQEKTVELEHQTISYDVLVLALGAVNNFFNIEGAQEYCLSLKTLKDAQIIKNKILAVLEEANQKHDEDERKKLLSFSIVGAGPTGVELAGELAEWLFETATKEYTQIKESEITLNLINSDEFPLKHFERHFQENTQKILTNLGVNIINNTKVVKVESDSLTTSGGQKIPSHTTIWSAGVKANPVSVMPEPEAERGRILVDKNLRIKSGEDVFVLGDIAGAHWHDESMLPMLAQVAKEQGEYIGKNIESLLGRKSVKPFEYREKGRLVSLGNHKALAKIGPFHFSGFIAWFMWRTIYLFNFASWPKRLQIMLDWTINFFRNRDLSKID
ncbi:MAG: NAD(P)/FAD-dependent oxidoreductase [Candidatus Paceibacterota bacterium]